VTATAETVRKRRWPRYFLIGVLALIALFYLGGGWYFSNQIRDDLLAVKQPAVSYDLEILATDAESITLHETEGRDDELRGLGVYGVTWEGGVGEVGDILDSGATDVTRTFAVLEGAPPAAGTPADVNKTVFPPDPARAFGVAFEEVQYSSPLGPMDAWFIPGSSDTWAVMVHGKGADRDETLRAMEPFLDAGLPILSIRYRNDIDQPQDPSGFYQYGVTEWQDLEGAVQYASDNGASDVVLVGLSTGGPIAISFLEKSPSAGRVAGAVLDAPNLDVERAVDFAASMRTLPVIDTDIPDSLTAVAKFIAGLRFDLDWDDLDYVNRAANVNFRMLDFHGAADETVPIDVSQRLNQASRLGVTLLETPKGLHVGSWNIDPDAYTKAVREYLATIAVS
jgi:hypothetical protein